MRTRNSNLIQKQYRFDEEHNAYFIDVSLDDYDDVYDDWDPAPFKKRFIENEFDEFIVTSAEDIPLLYNINIALYLPKEKRDTIKEMAVQSAYKNYYSYELEKVNKDLIKLRKKNFSYLILSIFFLSIGSFFQFGIENVLLEVLKEGVFIGGWVFLWEFFTNIFIVRRDLLIEYKQYYRLTQSEIVYVYI